MSFSLPVTDLYYLPRDDLAPERYEEITSPVFAWSRIGEKYVFDDRQRLDFKLINMHERAFNGYNNQPPPHGPREREKLKSMIYRDEVVMLGGYAFSKGSLFYIDERGALICRDRLAFKFDGARDIIREYNRSVARRDYSKRGGKPRPTALPARQAQIKQPAPLSVINSKAAGRLLAAGGMYNGNPEGFRQVAQQLGGEAPAGYDQMMSDQAKGLLITGASVAVGLGIGRLHIIDNIKKLPTYNTSPSLESPYLQGFITKSGTLLNAEHAVIDPKKLANYALNPVHPIGGNKAKVFESALGYNSSNMDDLIFKVKQGILTHPATPGLHDNFGQRMSVDMQIIGINGKIEVIRTGWMYETEAFVPRMTTIYVK